MSARTSKTQGSVSPMYIVGGPDPFLAGRQAEQLVDGLLTAEEKPMALWQPSPDALPETAEIFDELRTLPFLASRRVVVIKDADVFITNNRERLEKYLENPGPTGVLILLVRNVDKRTRLTKAVAKLGGVIETGQLKSYELPQYAAGYCRDRFGKSMNAAAAQMLVQFVGDDPGRICSEIEKLAIFTGSKKSITPEDIESLIGQNRIFGAFDVIDAVIMRRTDEALRRLRNMFDGDRASEFTVVGAFAYHFRKLFTARALLDQGLGQQAAAKKAGVWGPLQGQFFAQARSVRLEQIGRILVKLGRMDYSIKTGQTRAPLAMERLMLEIAPLFSVRS